jgi:hypothetical protein
MRTSAKGIHKGARVRVRGAGKHARGTVSREPDASGFVTYRSDYNQGERLAPLASVRLERARRITA